MESDYIGPWFAGSGINPFTAQTLSGLSVSFSSPNSSAQIQPVFRSGVHWVAFLPVVQVIKPIHGAGLWIRWINQSAFIDDVLYSLRDRRRNEL